MRSIFMPNTNRSFHGRFPTMFKVIFGLVIMVFLFIFVQMAVVSMASFGVFPTAVTQATVQQIIPDFSCSGKNNCSTDYHVTLTDDNGRNFYTTYYVYWNLPSVGQKVSVRYMTTNNFIFHNKVVSIE